MNNIARYKYTYRPAKKQLAATYCSAGKQHAGQRAPRASAGRAAMDAKTVGGADARGARSRVSVGAALVVLGTTRLAMLLCQVAVFVINGPLA